MAISRRALTTFTQQALNDGNQAISLLNSEVSIMRKAVLRNCMALDILSAPQGGTCATIQTERCVWPATPSGGYSGCPNHLALSPCPAGLFPLAPLPLVCSVLQATSRLWVHICPPPLRGRCHPLPRHWVSLCSSVAPSQPPREQEHSPFLSACQSP